MMIQKVKASSEILEATLLGSKIQKQNLNPNLLARPSSVPGSTSFGEHHGLRHRCVDFFILVLLQRTPNPWVLTLPTVVHHQY